MKKTTKKLLWIFIPIGAVLVAIILGLLLLIGLALIGGFFLLFPDLQQGDGVESLIPDTSITAPATNPTEPGHIHQWQDATCTEPKTCSACGKTEGEPAGHNYESVVTEPTFEGYGYTTYTCTHCGDHYEDDYIDPIKLQCDAGTLVFCADGVAYLIGEDHQIMEQYTSWDENIYSSVENTPWYNQRSGITSVVIEDGVSPESTDYWFCEFENLERVRIGNAVTTIGYCAFYSCYSLTSITIPDSVTYIDCCAFSCCTSLTTVTFDNNSQLTSIGEDAFSRCYNLTSITIPDSVTTIGKRAFLWCDSLTSITIPDSVTTIGTYAFEECTSLTTVTFGKNSQLISIGNYAFSDCASLTSITIPDSVTTIGTYAFEECTSLTSITIPDSVTTIGERAFGGCYGLTSITVGFGNPVYHSQGNCIIETASKTLIAGCQNSTIPVDGTVTRIGGSAFYYCTSLTSITIPDSVTTIGTYAFEKCTSLTSITIPDSVTSIGQHAFTNCYSLTSITIPDSVTTIGDIAFFRCTSLTSITIPDSVTTIGDFAFFGCSSLTGITFEGTVAEWNAIKKGTEWNENVPAKEVICSDGIVQL